MRITIDVDRDLIVTAKRLLGTRSIEETVETALRDAIARAETARRGWMDLIGSSVSWDGVDELLDYRKQYGDRSF